MRVIGVDLAWSSREDGRSRTGLCEVEDGHVVRSERTRTNDDDEIVQWIDTGTRDDVLVAFDAPLVVTNPGGCRGCERVVADAYRREEAGPYPANLALVGDPPRAWTLADRLGLCVQPGAIGREPLRAAIEVYPHPAQVVLIGLDRSLKYKGKRGRSVASRRVAFGRLFAFLKGLVSADPPLATTSSSAWADLLARFVEAQTNPALDVVEDELDAYVCAYVGLYHLRWAGTRSWVVGDGECGYIVIPVDDEHGLRIRKAAEARRVPMS